MPRAVSFLIFLTISLGLVAAVHYWVWARLVRDLALSPTLHRALTVLIVVLACAIPATFWLGRSLDPATGRPLMLVLYSWMGIVFLLLVVLAGVELVRLVVWLGSHAGEAPPDPQRRLLLARVIGGTAAALTAGVSLVALRNGLGPVRVERVRVELDRLPPELDGFRIVQMSDIHVGPTIGRELIATLVDRCNELDADVIAITGDLVDGSVERLGALVEPLAELKARAGVYFVTGNHEYYAGAQSWCDFLTGLGLRVLRNERVEVGRGGHTFDLAGVDDFNAFGRGHGANLPQAVAERDEARELVLLAHQPRAVHEAQRLGVGLQLSGHTHGGQLWPWQYFVYLQQPVLAGLKLFGKTQLYTSRGTGYWGPPMRLGASSEITLLELFRAPDRNGEPNARHRG